MKSWKKSNFPKELKFADITPVNKKENRRDKVNYRPVNIVPMLLKFFERCLYDQIYKNVDSISSKYQTGYRKDYSFQHSLI